MIAAAGLAAQAVSSRKARHRLVFTATQAGASFTVPQTGTAGNGQINGTTPIAVSRVSGLFVGTASWANVATGSSTQAVNFNVAGHDVAVNGERAVSVRFNNFALSGSSIAAGSYSTSANGYQITPAVWPALARSYAGGTEIRGGSLYGLQAITASLPGSPERKADISFRAVSLGSYEITVVVFF